MKQKSDTFLVASDIEWDYVGDGVVRQIMGYDENLMTVKVKCNEPRPSPV